MLLRRFAVGVLLLALGIPGSASADTGSENVTVGFGVSVGAQVYPYLDLVELPHTAAACQLSVAPNADGFDLLDAAVAQGCIVSYATSSNKLTCIDGVCDRSIPFSSRVWFSWYSDPLSLDGFSASEGSEFVASYRATVIATLL